MKSMSVSLLCWMQWDLLAGISVGFMVVPQVRPGGAPWGRPALLPAGTGRLPRQGRRSRTRDMPPPRTRLHAPLSLHHSPERSTPAIVTDHPAHSL